MPDLSALRIAGTNNPAFEASVTWGNAIINAAEAGIVVSDRVALAAVTATDGMTRRIEGDGLFIFDGADIAPDVAGGIAHGDAEQGLYVLPASDATGASGAWVRTKDAVVTPRAFGCENGTDCADNLEAFFGMCEHMFANGWRVSHSGDFTLSRGIAIDVANARFSDGELIVRPPDGVYVDEDAIRIFTGDGGQWGSMRVEDGTGVGRFRNGIVASRIRLSQFAKLKVNGCALYGLVVATNTTDSKPVGYNGDNSNDWSCDEIEIRQCGVVAGVTIPFVETARSYTANSTAQTSTISVDLDAYYPTYAATTPFRYNSKWYAVLSYDSATNVAVVYPCLAPDPDALVSGDLLLVPGGGACTAGNDSGQSSMMRANIRDCAVGAMLNGTSGGRWENCTFQDNGWDIVHGRPPAFTTNSGETIGNYYSEGYDFGQVLTLNDLNSKITIEGATGNITEMYQLRPLPRTGEKFGDGGVQFHGHMGTNTRTVGGPPRVITLRRGRSDAVESYPDLANSMAYPGGEMIISPDTGTRTFAFNLGVNNINTRAYGHSGFAFVGINFAVGNQILLTPPTGETLDGGAAGAVRTYAALPMHFKMYAARDGLTAWVTVIEELTSASGYIV